MALNSAVEEEKAVVTSEVASKEDVVQALIAKLVDPRLPSRKYVAPSSPPSEEQHKAIARQMHAVVVLYNYYHRKQNPELEFVDFMSFCTLAVTMRPTMVAFMKWTNECMSTEFDGAEDQLSVTEKAIKDACIIAAGLDASVDVPDQGGWPITKVAVLFIDFKRENCMLQHGAITEGVWSLFEKELDKPHINVEISSEKNSGEKRKRSTLKSLAADSDLLQIGYDVVKEITGIEDYQLKVLGTYITYSLTEEKSATQFYLVQGPVKFSVYDEVSLGFLAEYLQGPLASISCGSCSATDVVYNYHMLPYTGIISKWLSRKDLWPPNTLGDSAQNIINVCSLDKASKISVSPGLIDHKPDLDSMGNNSSGTSVAKNKCHKRRRHLSMGAMSKSSDKIERDGDALLKVNKPQVADKHATGEVKQDKPCPAKRKSSSDLEKFANGPKECEIAQSIDTDKQATGEVNQKHDEPCPSRRKPPSNLEIFISRQNKRENDLQSRPGLTQTIERDDDALAKVKKSQVAPDSSEHESARNNIVDNLEATNVDVLKTLQSSPTKGQFQETFATTNDTLKFSRGRNMMDSVIKKEGKISPETPDKEREACHDASLVGPSQELKSVSDLHGTSRNDGGTREKPNSRPAIFYRRRHKLSLKKIDNNGPDDGAKLNMELVDSLKNSYDNQCKGKVSGQSGEVGGSSDESGTAKPVNQLFQLETTTTSIVALQAVPVVDLFQNALALLYNKQQQLFSEICSRGDMLAQTEHFIERIRDHGDIGLARECTESILRGNNGWMLNHGEKEIRSSGKIIIPWTSNCKDLEDICVQNNWRLPRYNVEPSNGKFISKVSIVSNDFNLTSRGGWESSPIKARESAAEQMMADICAHIGENELIDCQEDVLNS